MRRNDLLPCPGWLRLAAATGAAALLTGFVPAAGAQTVDFDSLPPDTFLTGQLRPSLGVSFPDGVIVEAHAGSRSLPNVAVPPFDGEFARMDVLAAFAVDQTAASIAFKIAEDEYGRPYVVTLTGLNVWRDVVQRVDVRFVADDTWRVLTVGDWAGGFAIRRVTLSARRDGADGPVTNFMRVDDLQYSSVAPPSTDTVPPLLTILQPGAGALVVGATVPVEVSTSDSFGLQTVNGSIRHLASGRIVGRLDYCGSAASGACDFSVREMADVSLEPALEGPHRITVTSCDTFANCATATRDFSLDPPDPPAEVRVERVEINQGVQPDLFEVGPPGDISGAISPVRLVGGRDTVVRFYPFAVGADRERYTARMAVRVRYRDGSTVERFSAPNAGTDDIFVAADPGAGEAREQAYVLMRPVRDRTLNYVIPASLLVDAASIDVRLEDPLPRTGWLRVLLNREVRLAVKHMRLIGPGINMGTADPTPAGIANAWQYVRQAWPISELSVIASPTATVPNDDACEVSTSELTCTVRIFSYYDPPGDVPPSTRPTHLMKLGRVPYGSFPNVGIALWGSALAMVYGDSAYAHEVAHTAGRPHAGGFHDEAGGEDWPYVHGQVGPTDFGVILEAVTAPGFFDLGEFDLTVVDPCPGATTVVQRSPMCLMPDSDVTHDFMSYGDGVANLGPLSLTSFSNGWVSAHTWNRLYDELRGKPVISATSSLRNAATAAGRSVAAEAAVEGEYLVIDAIIDGAGRIHPQPIERLSRMPAGLPEPTPGPYTLELYGHGRHLLLSRRFDVTEIQDAAPERAFVMGQVVAYPPALRRVVVKKDGAIVFERKASRNAPSVRVVYPNGGEVLASGTHTVTWMTADADGDPVSSRVEYSSDGGATWGTLGVVAPGEPAQLAVDVSELPPSVDARLRVAVSDGFLTAADASDCPLAVGGGEPVDCATVTLTVGLDFKPGSADNCYNPRSKGVVAAAILGGAGVEASAIDPDTLVLGGLTVQRRANGQPQCTLRDVSGDFAGAPAGRPDGFVDLVCHFTSDAGAWNSVNGSVSVHGTLRSGEAISGTDAVCTVP